MARREAETYGDRKSKKDFWSSDVTDWMTITANRGRTAAAGVIAGACLVGQVFKKPKSGSGA